MIRLRELSPFTSVFAILVNINFEMLSFLFDRVLCSMPSFGVSLDDRLPS